MCLLPGYLLKSFVSQEDDYRKMTWHLEAMLSLPRHQRRPSVFLWPLLIGVTPDISEPYEKACFVKQPQCLWSWCQTAPSRLYQQSLCSVTAIMITINFGCCPKRSSRCSKQRIRAFLCRTKMSERLSFPCSLQDISYPFSHLFSPLIL